LKKEREKQRLAIRLKEAKQREVIRLERLIKLKKETDEAAREAERKKERIKIGESFHAVIMREYQRLVAEREAALKKELLQEERDKKKEEKKRKEEEEKKINNGKINIYF